MKDSAYELISAIITLLGSTLAYNNYLFSVYDDLPENPTERYVWFPSVQMSDASMQDGYRLETLLTIEVVSRGHNQKASRQAIVSIGTIILTALIRKSLSMTNFYLSETAELSSITHGTAFTDDGGMTLTGQYVIRLVTEQK
jgi:hypothetical protein